jgi:tetratricopeptide (TPR) repeat protein
MIEKAIEKAPSRMDFRCARNYFLHSSVQNSLQAYQKCQEDLQQFQDFRFHLIMGEVCMRLGKYQEAKTNLLESKKLFTYSTIDMPFMMRASYFQLYYQMGKSHYFLQELDSAIDCFKYCRTFDIKNSAPHFWEGLSYLKQGKNQEAIDVMELGFKVNPSHGIAIQLSSVYMQLQDHQKAMEILSRCIEKLPEIIDAYLKRAELHFAIGQMEKMEKDILHALQNSKSAEHLQKTRQCLHQICYKIYQMQKFPLLSRYTSMGIEKYKDGYEFYLLRSIANRSMGKIAEPKRDLQFILDNCRHPQILQQAQNLWKQMGY